MKRFIRLLGIGIALFIISGTLGYAALRFITTQPTPDTTHQSQTASNHAIPSKPQPLECVANLPLTQRIGQKIMVAGYASELKNETDTFTNASLGGIILMNEMPAEQIAQFTRAMPIAPIIAVDQEGGSVQRYQVAGTMPSATTMVATNSPDAAYQRYLADNQYLKNNGITTNFAPVVDVISHEPSPLPERMYSSDPAVVSDYASSSIRAAQAAGITPVIKHFPGLGSASGNTDFTSATTDPLEALTARDLIPYKTLASLHPDVMVGNMIVPDLTDGQPAIWSKKAIDLLRSLGYKDAVIYTDSLTAKAITGSLDDAVIKTWQAGTDVAVIVQSDSDTGKLAGYLQTINSKVMAAIASKAIDSNAFNESVLRIFTRKHVDPCSLASSQPKQ